MSTVTAATATETLSSANGQRPPTLSARTRQRLRDAVQANPVTIVIGPTGCGKSTQVPQVVWDEVGGPILSSQPRRLAVVAVASRVAQERQVRLGGPEVGYYVGQSKHATSTTQLLFVTAGILLEQLRSTLGVKVLLKYKAIIIDECHERSPESDLVLAIVRSFLLQYAATRPIRIILMSATFDHQRYSKYFSDVPGCDRIDTINLETAAAFESHHDRVEVLYLDHIFQRLPHMARRHAEFQRVTKFNPVDEMMGEDKGKSLSNRLLAFVADLVEELHEQESPEGVFMMFAPTYRHLEQLYTLLRSKAMVPSPTPVERADGSTSTPLVGRWKVAVLHSSVDMEYCLRTMRLENRTATTNSNGKTPFARRKILLASAIADSSVTVPGVTIVIDLCRSLEVAWNNRLKIHAARTVWASQSTCDQRKGRTGRTCPGRVFRLLPQAYYLSVLAAHDQPQLTLSSCRDETLKLLCARKHIPDPARILEDCLDPPHGDIVQQSLEYLESIGACIKGRRRYQATKAGELMAALAFPVEDSYLILTGGRLAVLHEVLVLRAIATHKPSPIMHHFGENYRNEQTMMRFYPRMQPNNPTSVELANLAAFLFWDVTWNGSRTRTALQHFEAVTKNDSSVARMSELPGNLWNGSGNPSKSCGDVFKWTPALEEKHIQWCEERDINPTGVRSIAELIHNAWSVLFNSEFEPAWLRCTQPTPEWLTDKETMVAASVHRGANMIDLAYGGVKGTALVDVLTAMANNPAWAADYANRLATQRSVFEPSSFHTPAQPQQMACIHFLMGNCAFGDSCRNSHRPDAPRPPCRFFRAGNCTRGDQCLYSHNLDDMTSSPRTTTATYDPKELLGAIAPIKESLDIGECHNYFFRVASKLMLLGEGVFDFSRALAMAGYPPRVASDIELGGHTLGSTLLVEADATRLHLAPHVIRYMQQRLVNTFAWIFPNTDAEEDDGSQESLLLGTFLSLAQLIDVAASDTVDDSHQDSEDAVTFAVALHANQFSRWNVMANALRTGWHLESWGPFESKSFPRYTPRTTSGDSFVEQMGRLYVFGYYG